MSLKTICFLTLLIVSCTIAKPINNLKKQFLSKTSAQIPTQSILAQVKSLSKVADPDCAPTTQNPNTVQSGISVTSICHSNAPPTGCIWFYRHCSVSASINEGPRGVIQWCGTDLLLLENFIFYDPNVQYDPFIGPTYYSSDLGYNLSGVRLAAGSKATLTRWDGEPRVDSGHSRVINSNTAYFLCMPEVLPPTPLLNWNDRVHTIKLSASP